MPEIGVQELETHAAEIIRELRENRVRYVLTYNGEPVGLLVPLDEIVSVQAEAVDDDAVWDELMRLGEEIARGWKSPISIVDTLSQMRDEEMMYGEEAIEDD